MSIIENKSRVGNFTSSGIYALMSSDRSGKGWGKPALTYISEKRMERRLGRSISPQIDARPLTWGNLLEPLAFSQLSFEYELTSQETLDHPTIEYWRGSPDGTSPNTVMDIKCPMTLKSFCTFADCTDIEQIRSEHSDGEKYYWQLVSNAILTDSQYAELIVFMPMLSDLNEIRMMAEDFNGALWITYADDNSLPYLIEEGHYKSLYTFRFEVPQSDKDLLTSKVIEAGKLLMA